jgi:hypothetical protein
MLHFSCPSLIGNRPNNILASPTTCRGATSVKSSMCIMHTSNKVNSSAFPLRFRFTSLLLPQHHKYLDFKLCDIIDKTRKRDRERAMMFLPNSSFLLLLLLFFFAIKRWPESGFCNSTHTSLEFCSESRNIFNFIYCFLEQQASYMCMVHSHYR